MLRVLYQVSRLFIILVSTSTIVHAGITGFRARHGTLTPGTAWAWHGTTRQDLARHGHGTARYGNTLARRVVAQLILGTARHGTTWHSTESLGTPRGTMARHGTAGQDTARGIHDIYLFFSAKKHIAFQVAKKQRSRMDRLST